MGRLATNGFLIMMSLGSFSAQAYTPTISAKGIPVRWKGTPKLNLAGNPINASGIDAGGFYAAVVKSLQRWQKASDNQVGFDYWQGTDANAYEPDSNYNGLSSVYFASHAKGGSHLSPNVLGLTQVWYNTDTGEIMETDVVLNDVDFKFTTNPKDTSGFGTSTSSFSAGKNNVFIENVLSHEFGHAYGLSHSGGLQSTMLYMESPEQAHLSCDEQIAIHALYPDTHAGARGAISGQVVSDAGKAVLGAHVLAISRQRGTVLATGLTDSSGHFQINALEPGDYFLMVEPYFAGSSALPSYYSAMTAAVCSGSLDFGRTFLTDPASLQLSSIEVRGGSTANVPRFVAHCSASGGAAITAAAGTDSINHASMATLAPAIFDSARNSRGFGLADRLKGSNPSYYRLQNVSGHLEIHALSYSLYSPIHPQLELLDINGKTIASAKSVASVYSGDSGFTNFDGALTADSLEAGDYFLKVTASTLDSTRYPAGPVALDTVPFVVMTGSVNESPPPLATDLSLNARCRMDEAFASYSSPGGDPPRQATSTNSTNGAGFCGTLSSSIPGKGGGSGMPPGTMVGWLAPWMLMGLIARLAKAMARGSACAPGISRVALDP